MQTTLKKYDEDWIIDIELSHVVKGDKVILTVQTNFKTLTFDYLSKDYDQILPRKHGYSDDEISQMIFDDNEDVIKEHLTDYYLPQQSEEMSDVEFYRMKI